MYFCNVSIFLLLICFFSAVLSPPRSWRWPLPVSFAVSGREPVRPTGRVGFVLESRNAKTGVGGRVEIAARRSGTFYCQLILLS
jgi:hypothetical protein